MRMPWICGREEESTGAWMSRVGIVACLLVLLCATACGAPDGVPSQVDVRTITLFNSSLAKSDPRTVLIESFERAHPTIRVISVPLPDDTDVKRKILTEAIDKGVNAPDVYFGDVTWPAEFGAKNLAMPLDTVIGDKIWGRFPEDFVEASKYDGKKYAVPFYADQGVLYYRKDKVRQAEVPRTWEELADRSREIKMREHIHYGFIWQGKPYEGLTCNWVEMVGSAGGRVIDDDGTRARMTSPESTRALRYMLGLIRDELTPPDVTRFAEPDSAKLFAAGDVAFMRGWNAGYPVIEESLGAKTSELVGVAPLPTFSGQPEPGTSAVGGWSLYVNPHTEKVGAVVELIDWLTDTPAQRTLAQYSEIPTGLQLDEGIVGSNPALKVVLENTNRAGGPRLANRPSNTPAYPEVSKAIYRNISRALTSGAGVPPEDVENVLENALSDADHDINMILEGLSARDRPTAPPP